MGPDGVVRALALPKPRDLTKTYFLRLRVDDAFGQVRSSNFYWLSTQQDVLDLEKTEWYFTPTKVHSDLTALARLPATRLSVAPRFESEGAEGVARVSVENAGQALAFQVHLKLVDAASGKELLPVYWDDNYFALFPGEKREIRVAYPLGSPAGTLAIVAAAWNAPRVTR